jgi:hypothetical protein
MKVGLLAASVSSLRRIDRPQSLQCRQRRRQVSDSANKPAR